MGGQFLLEADLGAEPVAFEDGALVVPHGPGLSGDLDPDKVRRYQSDAFEVHPD